MTEPSDERREAAFVEMVRESQALGLYDIDPATLVCDCGRTLCRRHTSEEAASGSSTFVRCSWCGESLLLSGRSYVELMRAHDCSDAPAEVTV